MSNITDDLKVLGENLERLKIENNLLRAASKEQKELNGSLRQELQDNSATLASWINWFNTWGILIDGDCYAEGSNLVSKSIGVINGSRI